MQDSNTVKSSMVHPHGCSSIVVIGASAGGVEALSQLVAALSADLPAALLVAMHFPSYSASVLPQILSRAGALPALHPQDRETIKPGHIYVAPPDHHLLVDQGYMRLSRGPRENGHRPAIDALFRSAARCYGRRTIGVILSGMLDDGTAGLLMLKTWGGIAIVQDPEEAVFDSMPRSALANVQVDQVLPVSQIAVLLVQLAQAAVAEDAMANQAQEPNPPDSDPYDSDPSRIELAGEAVHRDKAAFECGERPSKTSTLTCPDCGGVLWELHDDQLLQFRCHVGHVYSLDSLVTEQTDSVERALWSGVRALEEKAALARRMAAQAKQQHRTLSEAQFRERAAEAAQQAILIRQLIAEQTQQQTQLQETGQASFQKTSNSGNGDTDTIG